VQTVNYVNNQVYARFSVMHFKMVQRL